LPGPEQEAIVKLETSWFREGLQQGRQEGRQEATAEVVSRLLVLRLGILPSAACEQIQQLTPEQLATLVEQLLGFASIDDLEQWLRRQKPNPGE
jgi:flagellar biosynthesis/type III secretory pathway protein FliH